jgi:curved DNA-binding protein
MADYYNTLGISKDANPDEIKKAYRKLASQHHPDKGGDKEKFQEIQAAYATLSDPEKRQQYDNPAPQGFQQFGGVPPGFEDVFSQMFGGGGPGPFGDIFGHRRQQVPRNQNVSLRTQITLDEVFSGKDVIADLRLPSGQTRTVEIKIPPGIQSGQTLRVAGGGEQVHRQSPPGDLMLEIHVLPHKTFTRNGDDLHSVLHITAWEAMLGIEKEFTSIDGALLKVQVPAGIQPGQMIRVPGRGLPILHQATRGNQFLDVNISIPRLLTTEQKDFIKQFLS